MFFFFFGLIPNEIQPGVKVNHHMAESMPMNHTVCQCLEIDFISGHVLGKMYLVSRIKSENNDFKIMFLSI